MKLSLFLSFSLDSLSHKLLSRVGIKEEPAVIIKRLCSCIHEEVVLSFSLAFDFNLLKWNEEVHRALRTRKFTSSSLFQANDFDSHHHIRCVSVLLKEVPSFIVS